MKGSKHTIEQIILKLREAEVALARKDTRPPRYGPTNRYSRAERKLASTLGYPAGLGLRVLS